MARDTEVAPEGAGLSRPLDGVAVRDSVAFSVTGRQLKASDNSPCLRRPYCLSHSSEITKALFPSASQLHEVLLEM